MMEDEGGGGGGGGGRSLFPVVVSALVTLLLCALQLMGVLRPRSGVQIIPDPQGNPPDHPRLMEALRRTAHGACRGCVWMCAFIVAVCLGSGSFVVLLGLSGAFAVWELHDLMQKNASEAVEPAETKLSIPTLACCSTIITMPRAVLSTNGVAEEIPDESEATQGALPLFVPRPDEHEELSIPMEVFSPQFISAQDRWSASVDDMVWHPVGTQGKAALLLLGFFPNHHQLDYLRHKSDMEMMIVALQGLGYLTSVVVRLVQRLPPSPLELIAAMSSVALVPLPVLQKRFGCFLFRRDLVIHLNDSQAKRWLEARKSLLTSSTIRSSQNRAKACGLAIAAAAAFSFFVMYVYTHYWAAQPSSGGGSCAACFPIALLIIISIALHLTETLVRILRYKIHTQRLASYFLLFVASVIHICSVVLAIKATTKDWHRGLFDKPHKSLFQWIIPHV